MTNFVTSQTTTPVCFFCGRPIIGSMVSGLGGETYHPECTYAPSRQFQGQLTSLTEEDIRRIVREELAHWQTTLHMQTRR